MKTASFTIIEIILYVAITSIVLVFVTLFSLNISTNVTHLDAKEQTQSELLFAIERITREIQNSQGVDASQSVFGTTASRLALRNASGETDYIELIPPNNTGIRIRRSNGTLEVLATEKSSMSALVFRNESKSKRPGVIQVEVRSSLFPIPFTTAVTFREPIEILVPPFTTVDGCSGIETDAEEQFCSWDVGPPPAVSSVSVKVEGSGGTLFTGIELSGSYNFDAAGLGGFTCDVTVRWQAGGQDLTRRTCQVTDDDTSPPTIALGGSTGSEPRSRNQVFTWSATDVSGISVTSVIIKKNGATIATFSTSSGSFDFNSFGTGTFVMDVQATDGDNDRPSDGIISAVARRSVVVY